MKEINFPAAPAKIDYSAWNTEKHTRRAASKLRSFGNILDRESLATFGGKAEAVVRGYWKKEMPKHESLCNHKTRETIASWSFWQKVDFLNSWGNSSENARVSPLPFMVMSQLGKETGKKDGIPSLRAIKVQDILETAVKPIFEAMARNILSFAGMKETAREN